MSSGGSCIAASIAASSSSRSIRPSRDQPVVEPLLGADVGVLEVDQLQLGVVPVQAVALAVLLEQLAASPPSPARRRTASGRARAGRAPTPSGPARRRSARRRRRRTGPRRTCGPGRGTPAAAGRRSACGRRCSVTVCCSVGSWETARSAATGAVDGQVRGEEPVLDHRQHQRGGADLEVGRDLGEVGVADDHVQPAVLLGVGVRLVAGVDDRPLERGLEADLDLEVVGALADLEAVLAAVLADPDPAGAADDLAADEERRQVPDDVARTASTRRIR